MAIRRRPQPQLDGEGQDPRVERVGAPQPTQPGLSGSSPLPGVTPGVAPPDEGRGEETPRDRQPAPGGATPRRPMSPSPMTGSTSGLQLFNPMPGPSPVTLANPAKRGMFGSLGGLQGGGLGLPLDPTSNVESDPISGLIELLSKLGRG